MERTVDRIYRLLGLVYPWKDILAARWSLENGDPRIKASAAEYLDNTLVFLFETQLPVRPTKFAFESDLPERDYYTHWQGLKKQFSPTEVG